MPEADWLNNDLRIAIRREVDEHTSRKAYLNALDRGMKHYKSSDEWWVPVSTLDDVNISDKHPTSRENIMRESILEVNSILLKNDPMAITHPHRPEDAEISDEIDKIVMASWRNGGTRYVLRSMNKQAMICGLSIGKTAWDPSNKRRGSDGDVRIIKLAPRQIRCDPFAPHELRGRGCRYFLHTTRQTPESIIYRYEHEGAIALGIRSVRGRKSDSISRYLALLRDKLLPIIGLEERKGEVVDRRIPVDELWFFPITVKEGELAIGNFVDEKKYPYGLVGSFINEKRVRLMSNPFVRRRRVSMSDDGMNYQEKVVELGHKMHPFVFLYWIREDDTQGYGGTYDCEGVIKHQIPIQHSYNSLSRNREISARTMGNPPFTYIEDALAIPEKRITLGPGEGIPINAKYAQSHREAIQFHPGQPMAPEVHLLMMEKKEAIRDVVGLKPGMVGLSPQGTSHTDPATIGTLQEASFSAMWTPTEELMAAISDIADRYLGLIQQYYKPGRYVDVSLQGEANYVKINLRHIAAQFTIEVISGTTTPIYDMTRGPIQAEIKMQVDQALLTKRPEMMKSCVTYLKNLQYPYAYNWIQLLLKQIAEIEQNQRFLQEIGAMGVQDRLGAGQAGLGGAPAQMGQGGQLALPAPGTEAVQGGEGQMDEAGALADELGVSREQLIEALSE